MRVLAGWLVLAGDGDSGLVLAISAQILEHVGEGSCFRDVAFWQELPADVAEQLVEMARMQPAGPEAATQQPE